MIEVGKCSKSFKAQNCFGESLANPLLRISYKNEYLILSTAPQPIPVSKGLWQMFPQCLQGGEQHWASFPAPSSGGDSTARALKFLLLYPPTALCGFRSGRAGVGRAVSPPG